MWSKRLLAVFENQGSTEHFEKLVRIAYQELGSESFKREFVAIEAINPYAADAIVDVLIDDLEQQDFSKVQEFSALGVCVVIFLIADELAQSFEFAWLVSKGLAAFAALLPIGLVAVGFYRKLTQKRRDIDDLLNLMQWDEDEL